MDNYTKEQIKDITDREKVVLDFLKEQQFTPAAIIQKVRFQTSEGEEVFADKLTPYLADTKFVRQGNKFVERMQTTETTPKGTADLIKNDKTTN